MRRFLAVAGVFAILVADPSLTTRVGASGNDRGRDNDDPILEWNEIALVAVVDDHSGTFGPASNGGPTRTSRALAIVHVAMYDAAIAIKGRYRNYLPIHSHTRHASVEAAVAQAAHDTLVALYPNQASVLDDELRRALRRVRDRDEREKGIRVGAEAARNILAFRSNDGAAAGDTPIYPMTDPNNPLPGQHLPDPLNPNQSLLTPGWGQVDTFSNIDVTASDIRTPAPPPMNSERYTEDYNDVLVHGGDGIITPTLRTPEQTQIGIFWAYDGTPGVGPPPVLYNQAVRTISIQRRNSLVENARLFALVNIAMSDAGVASWDSKFYYNVWRPIMGVRGGDLDGNPNTEQVPNWTPLCAPASNQSGNNFTPPFPSYPSGHATFGGAAFRTLQNFYQRDNISFNLRSDEFNGITTDNQGNVRPVVVRHFNSFSQAAIENARSRIYLGIHWQFDGDAGIQQGAAIADRVYNQLLQPRR